MRWLFNLIDTHTERRLRQVAHNHGRRSLLTRLGVALVGGAVLPMLPFDRSGQFMGAQAAGTSKPGAAADKSEDPTQCEYWRYCAFDGHLCTCCGGSLTQCPPGTEASKVSWVGTCLNPKDGRHYLVSYNDCCGKGSCGQCLCNNNERERPGYRLGVHNDINWCMANTSSMFHCTTSVIVGVA
ncbi:methylamine dehydrogenase light chain [Paucibacter soli]|uniref:methylamine dehydrogenase light chain n=1 Tax=Paucibacter soli TaxID=3133433 RepID=UPI0030A333E2